MTPLSGIAVGSVEAPAGCGKTYSIVEQVSETSGKPALILTHTNAGIVALRERLQAASVQRRDYRLYTIDAWCQRTARAFPLRAQYTFDPLAAIDYLKTKIATLEVIKSGALTKPLIATYGLILVDEYQDCDPYQHAIITELATHVPTRVFGDPMQAIFDFKDKVVDWPDVQSIFPALPTLSIPWRWKRTGCDALGEWLLNVRTQIQDGETLDLTKAPSQYVKWICSGDRAGADALNSIKLPKGDKLLIIGSENAPATRFEFARRNAVSVVERADYQDLGTTVKKMMVGNAEKQMDIGLLFAKKVMSGADVSNLRQRIQSLQNGTAKIEASKHENSALVFLASPSPRTMYDFLEALVAKPKSRLFRPELYYVFTDALLAAKAFDDLAKGVSIARDKRRFGGRSLPQRAIGSTLLLKGLEAEHALVLAADELSGRHLYVALSRGSKSLTIVSPSTSLAVG